ncbi:MAG: hypothetical protein EOP07_13025 [Proteobacteria bacterium]|nr:MAG: hypothetical protein EOP07_13025 [Pseudomonadota bacterium]
MDHRKITLDPEDLKKLKALLKEEEARVEALADTELKADEEALEGRIRDFARGNSEGDSSTDSINTNWEKIQSRMNGTTTSKSSEASNVHAFVKPKPKKALPWGTIGGLAAAALALLVLYPKLSPTSGKDPTDLGQMQTKGTGTEILATNFCDVDVVGPNANSVDEAANGLGYFIRSNERFTISLNCDASGFIQIWSPGSPLPEVRNIKVERNVRTAVTKEDGNPVEFSLHDRKEAKFSAALTNVALSPGFDLLEAAVPASKLGEAKVLWSDSILVKGK